MALKFARRTVSLRWPIAGPGLGTEFVFLSLKTTAC